MSGYVVPSDPLSMLFNVSFTLHPPPPPSFIQLFNRKSFLLQLISHPAIPFPPSLSSMLICVKDSKYFKTCSLSTTTVLITAVV